MSQNGGNGTINDDLINENTGIGNQILGDHPVRNTTNDHVTNGKATNGDDENGDHINADSVHGNAGSSDTSNGDTLTGKSNNGNTNGDHRNGDHNNENATKDIVADGIASNGNTISDDHTPGGHMNGNTTDSNAGNKNATEDTTTNVNTPIIPDYIHHSLAFEKTQWATGDVLTDPFYSVSDIQNASTASAGTLLKLESTTDTTLFNLPPSTSLSRIVYQSKTLTGTLVPVSAYILWPHTARSSSDGHQIVSWAHGTSGVSPNCAPSHLKNLWQHFLAPFQLALQGYVVVATDYAGLGVSQTANGDEIVHEYLASPAHANDVFYAVQAAQEAFPELGKEFVVAGHSQGGGAAWGCAQTQANEPVEGYLGAVAISPATNIIDEPEPILPFLGTAITPAIQFAFPEFEPASILTNDGLERLKLVQQLGGCTATMLATLAAGAVTLMQENWTKNEFVRKFQSLVVNGGKPVSGPLLVIHGEADPNLDVNLTTAAVDETVRKHSKSSIKYLRVPGTPHNAAMTSTQWLWMEWIAERFAGVAQKPGLQNEQLKLTRPAAASQKELNWWIAPAVHWFETP